MNDLMISRDKFSKFFWDDLIDRSYYFQSPELTRSLEALRIDADYATGSLNAGDCQDVHAVFSYFKPRTVAEIGTFIGRSTHAIASALDAGDIWTCDASNALDLPAPAKPNVTIRQFKKQTSTQMLKIAQQEGMRFGAFYVDGRLSEEDVELMFSVTNFDGGVIVLDDFEGIEKGVANASMIMNAAAKAGGTMALIYPREGGKTAVMLPFTKIRFVPQV